MHCPKSWIAAICLQTLLALPALAQLQLPRPSPTAKLTQNVGLTEIAIEYSSPSVKGRKIWGGVVPYGEVWRAGANQATKVTFSKDVKVADKMISAGSYAFFAIPSDKQWMLILNKDFNQNGAANYKQDLDVIRFQAPPKATPHRERLAYLIQDFTDDAASLDLEWEKIRVSLPIKLDTTNQVATNIQSLQDNAWAPWNAAARYMLENKKDYDAGLKLVERSIALKEDWFNLWTKASLLAAKGDYRNAYPLGEKAKQIGEKTPERFFLADEVKKSLAEWRPKH